MKVTGMIQERIILKSITYIVNLNWGKICIKNWRYNKRDVSKLH